MSEGNVRASVCPDDELLAAYLEHRLDEARRETVERHVAACTLCADVVAASLEDASEVAPPALPRPLPPPARPQLGVRRLALAASLILASTSVLGYAGGHLLLAALGRSIAYGASRAAGASVTVGGVRLGIRPGPSLRLRLYDVRIASPAPMAAARIEVTTALAALVRGELAIETAELVRPLLQVGEGAPAVPGVAPPPRRFDFGGSGAILAVLARGALEVRDGIVVVTGGEATPLTIVDVNGRARPRPQGVTIDFSGALGAGRVTATGTIASEASGGLDVTIAGADLALDALPYGRERATGTTTLRVVVAGSASAPTLRGDVQISGARIRNWNPFPRLLDPPSAPGLLAATLPTLATPDLALDDLRARFAVQGGTVRIHESSFEGADLRGAGSLTVQPDGTIEGAGRVALPPALSQALLAHTPALGVPFANGSLVLPFAVRGSVAAPQVALQ